MRALLIILSALFLSAHSPHANSQEQSPHFGPEARAAIGAYRGMVEEHIAGIRRALHVIADSAEARSGSWQQCGPLLTRLSSDLSTDATAWFVNPDGSYSATEAAGETDQNLKDRPYFASLMSGKEVFGDLEAISKAPETDNDCGELYEGEIVFVVDIVSGFNTAEVLKPGEEALYFPSSLVAAKSSSILSWSGFSI